MTWVYHYTSEARVDALFRNADAVIIAGLLRHQPLQLNALLLEGAETLLVTSHEPRMFPNRASIGANVLSWMDS